MKGSNRTPGREVSRLKEGGVVAGSLGGQRIGTRSSGRLSRMNTRSPRRAKLIQALPQPASQQKTVTRRSRSVSPGNTLNSLKTKRARLENLKGKGKTPTGTPKTPAQVETPLQLATSPHPTQVETPRLSTTSPHPDQNLDGTEPTDGTSTPVPPVQSTPKSQAGSTLGIGAKMRTRLSTGSIQMNGTMTISGKQEKAELDEIIKQISKSDGATKTTPTSGLKKRVSQTMIVLHESGSTDHPPPKRRKIGRNDGSGEDNRNDYFCWLCHKEGSLVCCELCPRVYHTKCLGLSTALPQDWVCPECEKIMRAECVDTRSKSMSMLTIEQLCTLLKYALDRMKHSGSEPFHKPVDLNAVPNYSDYIFHPMDLSTLEKNIKKKMYGCTEALLADTKWILHNCIIYNGAHNKLTAAAKMIIKICKHEMNEIELCPDCYLNSCVRRNDEWFSETCRVPHTLVWAKLKGYPFWPSKALREVDGQVDVRFFGAHDRSWVPVSQCFLLSKNIPTSLHGKKNNGLDMAIEELNLHVNKLREKFGNFEYAPFRTPYDKTDIYKPITVKPDNAAKPSSSWQVSATSTAKPDISSPRKLSSNSGLSSKTSTLRQSAVAKTASALRNKYSAMVSLKKIDINAEYALRKGSSDEESAGSKKNSKESLDDTDSYAEAAQEVDENLAAVSKTTKNDGGQILELDNSTSVTVKLQSLQKLEDEKTNIEDVIKTKESQPEINSSDRGIKKSFVSTSLIERLENKLKALDAEKADVVNEAKTCENEDTSGKIFTKDVENNDKTKENSLDSKHFETLQSESTLSPSTTYVNVKSNSDSTVTETLEQGSNKLHNICDVDKSKTENIELEVKDIDIKEAEKLMEVDGKDSGNMSRDSYRQKLESMIKSCKEKLGMEMNDMEDFDSALSDVNAEDEDASSDDNEDSDDESSAVDEEDSENAEKDSQDSCSVEGLQKSVKDSMDCSDGSVSTAVEHSKGKSESVTKPAKDDHLIFGENTEGVATSKTHAQECTKDIPENSAASESNENKDKSTSKMSLDVAKLNKSNLSSQLCSNKHKEGANTELPTSKEITVNKLDTSSTDLEESTEVAQKLNAEEKLKESNHLITDKSEGSAENKIDKHEHGTSPKPNTITLEEITDMTVSKIPINSVSDSTESSDKEKEVAETRCRNAIKVLDPVSGIFSDKGTEDEDSDADRLVIDMDDDNSAQKNRSLSKSNNSESGKAEKLSKSVDKDSLLELSNDSSGSSSPTFVNRSPNKSSENSVKESNSGCTISSPRTTENSVDISCKNIENVVEVSSDSSVGGSPVSSSKVKSKKDVTTFAKPAVSKKVSPTKKNSTRTRKQKSSVWSPHLQSSVIVMESQSVHAVPGKEGASVQMETDPGSERVEKTGLETDVIDLFDDVGDMPLNLDSCLPDANFTRPPETLVEAPKESQTASIMAEKFSKKLLETIRKTMDEMCSEVLKEKSDIGTREFLNQQLAQSRWQYFTELNELKHNFQLTLYEMKSGWESEKEMLLKGLTVKLNLEKEQAVKETKKKQWCAQCGKEAIFYCCWNTSYCDYPCQQSHWPQHMHMCLQTNKDKSTVSSTASATGVNSPSQPVNQAGVGVPVSVGPIINTATSLAVSSPPSDGDHLRRLQENLNAAIQREEEKRGETRPGVSPKFPTTMTSTMQNIRMPGPQQMSMFNMQNSQQASMMQQFQRTRFLGQQQMLPVQQRGNIPQSQQINPRMVFSQPLIQQTIYPVQVAQQQQLGGTILFPQSPQQNIMAYGMPPRPY